MSDTIACSGRFGGFPAESCTGELLVGGLSLNTPAWDVTNYTPLWFQHAVRGDNLTLPSTQGRRAYPLALHEGNYSLVIYVTGVVDQFGTPFPDPWHGLRHNLDTLWTYVCSPVLTGDGTRACVLEVPGGANRNADVQFEPLLPIGETSDPQLATFALNMRIPAGRFA